MGVMTRPDSGDPPASPTPLMTLIRDRMEELRLSFRDLARRSGLTPDGRPVVPRASLGRYATQPLKRNPDPETVAGLARALDLGVGTVREAVGRSLNLVRGEPDERQDAAADLAERIHDLPADARAHVVWVVERILAGIGAVNRAEPRRDVGEDVAEDIAEVYDRLTAMTPEQRHRALDALDAIRDDGELGRRATANGSTPT